MVSRRESLIKGHWRYRCAVIRTGIRSGLRYRNLRNILPSNLSLKLRPSGELLVRTFPPLVARVSFVVLIVMIVSSPLQSETTTAQFVTAANTFLGTLNPEQRQKVLYTWDDAEQRAR
jgi:hypothetical protein